MKKLIFALAVMIVGVVFSLTGVYAATTDAAGTSEKPAAAEPAATASQPADGTAQAPAGSQGMQGMPMKGHGKGHGGGMMHMRGGGMGGGCGMMQMGGGMGGCGMMQMAGGCPMMQMGGMKPAAPLTMDDAKARVESRLAYMHNPNLKLGNVTDQGATYEAEIVTQNGSLVDKLIIHKDMGWMRSIY